MVKLIEKEYSKLDNIEHIANKGV